MNFENSVNLYNKFLKQQAELRRVGLEINDNQDAEEIKRALEEAYLNESDRFEKVKIKQRIEETSSEGAGLSKHAESVLQEHDIKATALELKDAFIAETKTAKQRHAELNTQLNQKINAKSKELDQLLKDFEDEVKPITDEINLISAQESNLVSTLGRKENALGVMNRFGESKISYAAAGYLGKSLDVRKTLLSKIVNYTRRDLWNYFKRGGF